MAANATSAEACIASWGASEVNPTSASIKRASSHLNVTHAYPYLISAKLSSSGAPDAPESVGSWGFDEDSDSSQSSQFWDSSLCETPQRTKGMPNEDQAADPGCCTFEIDLSYVSNDPPAVRGRGD